MIENYKAVPKRGPATAMLLVLATLSAPFVLAGTAMANPTPNQCRKDGKSCDSNCNRYTPGPFRTSCLTRCAAILKQCLATADTPGKVDTGGEPGRPKGTTNNTPPTGGTTDGLKASPRVNGTRGSLGGDVLRSSNGSGSRPDASSSLPVFRSGFGRF